jgi:2-methylisocitrate lyase-like PEP mutase family enzyme
MSIRAPRLTLMTGPDERAAAFLALHRPGAGFILPNVWDPGSARILEQVGFGVLATTSAGIAFSLGIPDGSLTREQSLDAIARIVSAVSCPVTADLEAGYAEDAAGVAATVTAAIAAGAVGGNLEDAYGPGQLYPPEEAADRIRAARDSAPRGTFVINARTDTYMSPTPDAFAETIRRARLYTEAGADCIFVPGIADTAEIGRLTQEIGTAVNIVSGLGPAFDAATLRSLGVARISIGGTLTRAVLGLVERAGREMLEDGTFGFAHGAPGYADLQARFSR